MQVHATITPSSHLADSLLEAMVSINPLCLLRPRLSQRPNRSSKLSWLHLIPSISTPKFLLSIALAKALVIPQPSGVVQPPFHSISTKTMPKALISNLQEQFLCHPQDFISSTTRLSFTPMISIQIMINMKPSKINEIG